MTRCAVHLIVRAVAFHEMPTGPVTAQDAPGMTPSMVAKVLLVATSSLISLNGHPTVPIAVENHRFELKRMTAVHSLNVDLHLQEPICLIAQSDSRTTADLLASPSPVRSREDPVLGMTQWARI
jgi:hypothetical protein